MVMLIQFFHYMCSLQIATYFFTLHTGVALWSVLFSPLSALSICEPNNSKTTAQIFTKLLWDLKLSRSQTD